MRHTTDPADRSQTRRDVVRLRRFCGLAADIAKLGSERRTLRKIVDTAATQLAARSAHLFLIDSQVKTLYAVARSGPAAKGRRLRTISLADCPDASRALRTRRPVIRSVGRHASGPERALGARHSLACLPLISGKQTFGLLVLIGRRGRPWSDFDLEMAKHVADFASVAIENTRLLKQLVATERRFRSLVEHLPAIIYTCTVHPPYTTLYISPQAEEMLGYPAEEWLGSRDFWMRVVHPDDADQVIDLSEELIRSKGYGRSEYRLIDRNGDIRWFRDDAILARDPSGRPTAWHGVMVEITGIKKMHRSSETAVPSATAGSRPGPAPEPPTV
jgi:PAS domain S-box-containing protein